MPLPAATEILDPLSRNKNLQQLAIDQIKFARGQGGKGGGQIGRRRKDDTCDILGPEVIQRDDDAHKLIGRFEKKIEGTIARVWVAGDPAVEKVAS